MPVMDRVRHVTILPFPRSPLGAPSSAAEISRKIGDQLVCLGRDQAASSGPWGKGAGAGIPKNRCRTMIAERIVETRAELPFIGDQIVCLSHDHAARSATRQKSG
jgi:hypothetical protein